VRACVRACVHACVRAFGARKRERERERERKRERERERVCVCVCVSERQMGPERFLSVYLLLAGLCKAGCCCVVLCPDAFLDKQTRIY
jgi:hypothetical protein